MRIHFKTDYLQDIRLFEDRREMIQYILLILAALSAPFWLDEYLLGEITYVLIYVLAGLGLMVLAGHTGQPSLGHRHGQPAHDIGGSRHHHRSSLRLSEASTLAAFSFLQRGGFQVQLSLKGHGQFTVRFLCSFGPSIFHFF